ncbi:hypothetical protein QYE76_026980 [Lolium multiflorum]|uniref:Uncharacterized protein n=1 Tax=Lolium multiflorum TaxID=4521 RepID=A0AAD8VDK4_LOLMU|nr:hypothetical protein QYE76_026980 [Lolium multiflorum]
MRMQQQMLQQMQQQQQMFQQMFMNQAVLTSPPGSNAPSTSCPPMFPNWDKEMEDKEVEKDKEVATEMAKVDVGCMNFVVLFGAFYV